MYLCMYLSIMSIFYLSIYYLTTNIKRPLGSVCIDNKRELTVQPIDNDVLFDGGLTTEFCH